jgi:hypothetical protein
MMRTHDIAQPGWGMGPNHGWPKADLDVPKEKDPWGRLHLRVLAVGTLITP